MPYLVPERIVELRALFRLSVEDLASLMAVLPEDVRNWEAHRLKASHEQFHDFFETFWRLELKRATSDFVASSRVASGTDLAVSAVPIIISSRDTDSSAVRSVLAKDATGPWLAMVSVIATHIANG